MSTDTIVHEQDSYSDLLFDVRRSVRYHTRRRAFFENLHSLVLFIGIVGGSASVGVLVAKFTHGSGWSWWPFIPGIVVTLFSALDLVVGTGRKTWRHADLSRRFIELEQKMVRVNNPDDLEDSIRIWIAERLQIETDEVQVLRILDIMCHNDLAQAMGYPKTERFFIPLWQRLIAHFANWRVDSINPYKPDLQQ